MTQDSEQLDGRRRLKTAADYQRVFERSRRSTDEFFLVLARDNEEQFARLGMALARRKMPTATARNRVRRIIRESFRRHQQGLSGQDLVVLARADLSHISNHVLFVSLAGHWARHAGRGKRH